MWNCGWWCIVACYWKVTGVLSHAKTSGHWSQKTSVTKCIMPLRKTGSEKWRRATGIHRFLTARLEISKTEGYGHWYVPSNRQHLSSGACLKDKREDNQNCSVLCSVRQLCTMIRTHTWAVLTFLHVRFRFLYVCVCRDMLLGWMDGKFAAKNIFL